MQAQPTTKSISDTICPTVSEYKVLLRDATLYRYTDTLLRVFKAENAELKSRMEVMVNEKEEQKKYYEDQLSNKNSQLAEKDFQIQEEKENTKKERRKRRAITAAAVAALGATIYLSTLK